MTGNSSKTASRRKSNNGKPSKPYKDFPLFPHASGRWAKKINGKLHYLGRWATQQNRKLVRVEGDGWREALDEYKRVGDDLQAGREPDHGAGCELRDALNSFLSNKRDKLDNEELSPQTFADYVVTCDKLVSYFNRTRHVDKLRPDDFAGYRAWLAQDVSIVTLRNEINLARMIFKYAHDQRLIRQPVAYGQAFDKPTARMLRKARNEAGPRLFSAEELRRILAESDVWLHAMTLLGINGGLGNTDVANLPQSAIDFDTGWLTYPRPKTEIQRKIPLWPETLGALRVAIDARPNPKDPNDGDLVFLTVQGNRWVRTVPRQKQGDQDDTVASRMRFVTRNSITGRFGKLLRRLGINGQKRRGFYTLRHVFETEAGESRDQVAVNAIMGHVDNTMAAHYRERISDERLQHVVDYVHQWLYRGTTDVS